ncbi:charged multivesicular body protein [Nanobdella aerobiophila]|uniref:Charged multivesicular body protein n=1 Tax=Nanobdella aerobiophila TaxID=2586965 RepID=A0A915SJV6_9ARCH|nr:hypothetical protein [Nanobdella aerobiophila]BBL45278.1 charged multivesicular body protein [Nanobdella aerobiophila]
MPNETFIDKYIDENQNISKYIFILYILFYFLSIIISFIYIKNYLISFSVFGAIYIPILYLLLKRSNTNMIKFLYILVPIDILARLLNINSLFIFIYNNIFFFIISYLIGNYIGEEKLIINRKSFIFYIISVFYLFILVYIYNINIPYLIPLILFVVLFNISKDNKNISFTKLNNINIYKRYIFCFLFILLLLQILFSLEQNIFFIIDILIFSIFEIIILYLIYKLFNRKIEGFTMYFLILFIFIFIFSSLYYIIYNNIIFYSIENILISIIFYFTAIHAYLYHKYPNNKKILLGISSGIPIIIINFIDFINYIIKLNIYEKIILLTLNTLIFGTILILLIYIHSIYNN